MLKAVPAPLQGAWTQTRTVSGSLGRPSSSSSCRQPWTEVKLPNGTSKKKSLLGISYWFVSRRQKRRGRLSGSASSGFLPLKCVIKRFVWIKGGLWAAVAEVRLCVLMTGCHDCQPGAAIKLLTPEVLKKQTNCKHHSSSRCRHPGAAWGRRDSGQPEVTGKTIQSNNMKV